MRANTLGALFLLLSFILAGLGNNVSRVFCNDLGFHQTLLTLHLAVLIVLVVIVAPLTSGWGLIRTERLGAFVLLGLCWALSSMVFALSLLMILPAVVVTISATAPLLMLAVAPFALGEQVSLRRWVLILVGFLGALLILRPYVHALGLSAFYPLAAVIMYAATWVLARRIGETENALTMTFYAFFIFVLAYPVLVVMASFGLFGPVWGGISSVSALSWDWPGIGAIGFLVFSGAFMACGTFLNFQAYRVAEVSAIAIIEYVKLPFSIILAVLIFRRGLTAVDYVGAAIILGACILAVWYDFRMGKSGNGKTS